MLKRLVLTVILFLCVYQEGNSQSILRLNYQRFGLHRKFDFQANDVFRYKRVESSYWAKNKILNFRDSTIFFNEEYGIRFNEIKKIKLHTHSYHNKLFQTLFLYAGVGYPVLYSFNSLILGYEPIITEQVVWISLSFLATSYLIKQIGIKRIKLNNNNFLKILELDFEHLNTP
jgi:hypothetical protein